MSQNSAVRKSPFGGDPADAGATPTGVTRKAPSSESVLKEIEQKLAEPPQKQKESVDVKKRRILERCGCL